MKREILTIICLLLLLSNTVYAATTVAAAAINPAIRKPAQQIVKPAIKPDVLRELRARQPITTATAPTLSLVWHGSISTNPTEQIWAMAADGVDGGRIFTSHTEKQNGSGAMQSVLRAFWAGDGSEMWTVSQPTSSFSFQNPMCVDGKLLVPAKGSSGKMQAYDPANGTKLWETPLPGMGFVTWGNSANGIIYHSLPGKYSALQTATGSYLWTNATGSSPGGPTAANGILYTASESSLKMVSAGTGQGSKWAQTNAHCDWSTPVARGLFVYCTGPYKLYALSTGDGSIAWQKPMNIDCSVGTPYQLIDTRNYICVLNSSSDITAHDPKTGDLRWQFNGDGIRNGRPIPVINEVIFLPGKTLTAINAANGSQLWSYNPGKTGSFTAATVVNDNMLIAQFGPELYVFTPM